MHWILKIAPTFLKKWDENLRLNHPVVWSTRIHLTMYLTLLVALLVTIISLLIPVGFDRVMSANEIESIAFVFMILTVILTGYNIIQLVLLNVGKRNGTTKVTSVYITFAAYFFAVVAPFLLPFLSAMVLNYRIANLLTDNEVAEQRNIVLKAEYYVNGGIDEYSSQYFYNNHHLLNNSNRSYSNNDAERTAIYRHNGPYKEQRPRLMKSRRYLYGNWSLESVDINLPIDSTIWLFYLDQNLTMDLDTAEYYLEAANKVIHQFDDRATLNVSAILKELANNQYSNCYSHYEERNSYNNYTHDIFPAEVALEEAIDPVSNIIKAKNRWVPRDIESVGYGYLWVGFYIACIVFVFKWVSWQQFLLMIFVTGLYFTIIGISQAFGRYGDGFMGTMSIVLLVAAAVGSVRVFTLQKFNRFTNYLAITAFYAAPLFLYWFDLYLQDVFHLGLFYDYYYINAYGDYVTDYAYRNMIGTRVIFVNIVLFFFLGLPYFERVFKRLNALPKKS